MNKRIIVIGDVMLDVYESGTSTRLSPEYPVPVVDDVKVENRLGGAANVCRTLKVFTDEVHLFSTVGEDYQGTQITSLLAEHNIDNDISQGKNSQTITKTRILSNNQQLCRLDSGYIKDAPPSTGASPDAIIVSDYGKGTITKGLLTTLITKNDCFILVDPKGTDWEKYTGVYALTPNIQEFEEAYGEFSHQKALDIIEELDLLGGILVTLGANGMHWVGRDGASILRQGDKNQVIDVCGAGDTVIAVFTLFLPEGIKKAMDYANRAAGDVVTKLGTAIPDKGVVLTK